jgi:hypothetical protein
LSFFFTEGVACRGVSHLAQTTVAGEAAHVAGAEHIAHHACGLVHEKLAIALRDDAGRILTPMLQQEQAIVNQLIDWCVTDNTNDSTHKLLSVQ